MTEERAPTEASAEPIQVLIEFDPGLELAGRVRATDTSTEFQGRLELYAAIERARNLETEPPGRRV